MIGANIHHKCDLIHPRATPNLVCDGMFITAIGPRLGNFVSYLMMYRPGIVRRNQIARLASISGWTTDGGDGGPGKQRMSMDLLMDPDPDATSGALRRSRLGTAGIQVPQHHEIFQNMIRQTFMTQLHMTSCIFL